MPAPPGGPAEWRERLVGPGGKTPAALAAAAASFWSHGEVPDGKDALVATQVRVRLDRALAAAAARRLVARREQPWFADRGRRDGAAVVAWVKPHAGGLKARAGHQLAALYEEPGNPSRAVLRIMSDEGHQVMGEIVLGDGWARVEAMTLSRVSVLMGALADAAGVPLDVASAEWQPAVPAG